MSRRRQVFLVWVLTVMATAVGVGLGVEGAWASAAFWIGAVILGWGAALAVRLVRRLQTESRGFDVDNRAGWEALQHGDFIRVNALYGRWLDAKLPGIRATARHRFVYSLIRQGDAQRAADFLEREWDREYKPTPALAMELALAYALLGKLEKARTWLDETLQLTRGETIPANGVLPAVIVDCRSGEPDKALRTLEDNWIKYEAHLTGLGLRPLRIVRAFAAAAAGPRSAGVADAALSGMRPAYPREYAYLGQAWPEMAQFLAAHQLDA